MTHLLITKLQPRKFSHQISPNPPSQAVSGASPLPRPLRLVGSGGGGGTEGVAEVVEEAPLLRRGGGGGEGT